MEKVFLGYPFAWDKSIGYRERLRSICEKSHFTLATADDRYAPEQIWDAIQKEIESAWYCIFDVTDLNPNVLLELGFAIGSGQDVIILQTKSKVSSVFGSKLDYKPLPSDLQSVRVIRYENLDDLDSRLTKAFEDMGATEHHDDQFWRTVSRILKNGRMTTKDIAAVIENELNFSYQMTRNRLETLYEAGRLEKYSQGRHSAYGLAK